MSKNEKILEIDSLLQSLSDEMLKLKTTSEHYDETKENLKNLCEIIDKISITHNKLTENMNLYLIEMESINSENKNIEKRIQDIKKSLINDFNKNSEELKSQIGKLQVMQETLTNNYNKNSEEIKIQINKIFNENKDQSKIISSLKILVILGILVEIVILVFIFIL